MGIITGKEAIHITRNGLLAGELYLREHCEEYNDGTKEGFHSEFIHSLVLQVLHASHIAIEMPSEPQRPQR
jgi:hypothetical protein